MKVKGYCIETIDYDYDYIKRYYFKTLMDAWRFFKSINLYTNEFSYDIAHLLKISRFDDTMYTMASKQNSHKLV